MAQSNSVPLGESHPLSLASYSYLAHVTSLQVLYSMSDSALYVSLPLVKSITIPARWDLVWIPELCSRTFFEFTLCAFMQMLLLFDEPPFFDV